MPNKTIDEIIEDIAIIDRRDKNRIANELKKLDRIGFINTQTNQLYLDRDHCRRIYGTSLSREKIDNLLNYIKEKTGNRIVIKENNTPMGRLRSITFLEFLDRLGIKQDSDVLNRLEEMPTTEDVQNFIQQRFPSIRPEWHSSNRLSQDMRRIIDDVANSISTTTSSTALSEIGDTFEDCLIRNNIGHGIALFLIATFLTFGALSGGSLYWAVFAFCAALGLLSTLGTIWGCIVSPHR
jgi:hypothetical protein